MSFVFRTAEFEAARCAWEGRSPPGRKPCRLLVVCVVIPLETGELGVEVWVEHRHGDFSEIPILLIAHFELGELHGNFYLTKYMRMVVRAATPGP